MSPELQTFLIAISPIIELRGAIPIAIGVYHLPIWSAYLFSVLGNLMPLTLIILLGEPVSGFLSKKIYFFNRLFAWIFAHTRKAQQSKFDKFGRNIAVLILVATPIPFIGGWTGAIAAFVFGVPLKYALPLIILGSLIAGAIVTILTLGTIRILSA